MATDHELQISMATKDINLEYEIWAGAQAFIYTNIKLSLVCITLYMNNNESHRYSIIFLMALYYVSPIKNRTLHSNKKVKTHYIHVH